MKRSILFVDDEPRILDGLRRMLRRQRAIWEMAFVESGEAALRHLAEHPIDVVVSDMRMPGMDGAELIQKIQDAFPRIVRIILSGQSNNEMTLRAVGPAHQYLSKPCDPEQLQQCIERACALRDVIHNEALEGIVAGIGALPSTPEQYTRLQEEINSPEPSIRNMGEIIQQDVGMTSKILQLVNSAFFGLPREIVDITEAVKYLGTDTISALVLSAHAFQQFESAQLAGLSIERFTLHALAVASHARKICIAEKCDDQFTNHAFLGGMLHDAGKLILAQSYAAQYKEVLDRGTGNSECAVEQQIFGVTHAEIGAYLFRLWGLPNPLIEAVAFHHAPSKIPHSHFAPVTAIHVANAFELATEDSPNKSHQLIDREYLARLNLDTRLSRWEQACRPLELSEGHA